jgi:hypothetical protein
MIWSRGPHLSDEALAQLVDEGDGFMRLSRDRSAHLTGCNKCSKLLEGHRRARAFLLKANPEAELPVPPSSTVRSTVLGLFSTAAGATVLIAVVVVVGLLTFRLTRSPETTGTGSSGQSNVPGSTLGGASPGASASPIPSASAGVWRVLAASDTAGAEWSPDGRWLLVWDEVTNGTPAERHVSLDDVQGNLVRTISGEDPGLLDQRSIAVWLDARSFVVTRGGANDLGTVDSAALMPISPPPFTAGVTSSGHGALAYATSANLDGAATYEVWTPTTGATPPRPGVPVSWSRDGTELAVWHWASGTGLHSSGWLEVVSWPDFGSIAADHQNEGLPFARFDPTGRYVYNGYVLDLATGTATTIRPSGEVSSPVWNQASQLVFPSLVDGSAATYDVHGDRQSVVSNVGDSASASADGSTVALWFLAQQLPITLLDQAGQRSFALPGSQQPPDPQLSPDGSGLVVVCAGSSGFQALLLNH